MFLIDKKQNFTAHDNTSRRVFEEAVMKRLWKVTQLLNNLIFIKFIKLRLCYVVL